MSFSTTVDVETSVDVDIDDDDIVSYVIQNEALVEQVLNECPASPSMWASWFYQMDAVAREQAVAHLKHEIPGIEVTFGGS